MTQTATASTGTYGWKRPTSSKALIVEQRKTVPFNYGKYKSEVTEYKSEVRAKFEKLKDQWKRDVLVYSDTSKIVKDDSYISIIALGPSVIPLILAELRDEPDHWSYALEKLTDENPVDEESYGNLTAIRDAWLEWGTRNDLLSS